MSAHRPFVVKSTRGRDVALAVIAGGALAGLLMFGFLQISREGAGHPLMTGRIVGKHFEAQKEEQLTVGNGGLDRRDVDGIYTMEVRTGDGRVYTVFVDKGVYEGHGVGDALSFLAPVTKGE